MENTANCLPDPSILSKLKAYDAAAPAAIMDGMAVAQQARFKEEASPLNRAFWAKNFRPETFAEAIQNENNPFFQIGRTSDWANVGDDMRAAIRDYMQEHDIAAADIGLTDEEIKDLQPVTRYYQNRMPDILLRQPEPPLSICDKLDRFSPGAAEAISKAFKKAAEPVAFTSAMKFVFKRPSFPSPAEGILQGMASVFEGMAGIFTGVPARMPGAPTRIFADPDPVQLAQYGDIRREAICTYMNHHNISASDIDLTAKEIAELKPITPDYKNRVPSIS